MLIAQGDEKSVIMAMNPTWKTGSVERPGGHELTVSEPERSKKAEVLTVGSHPSCSRRGRTASGYP